MNTHVFDASPSFFGIQASAVDETIIDGFLTVFSLGWSARTLHVLIRLVTPGIMIRHGKFPIRHILLRPKPRNFTGAWKNRSFEPHSIVYQAGNSFEEPYTTVAKLNMMSPVEPNVDHDARG